MDADTTLTVVKLGGSHAFTAHLRSWLTALAECRDHVVVVPGGGPFADMVRSAQRRMGFDDRAAHHMALLAMEQYGCALASLEPSFVLAATPETIAAVRGHGVAVWTPTAMALAADDIAMSWDVTSDSLAAWLAPRIGASRLLLVKAIAVPSPRVAAADLVAAGLVDPQFPRMLAASGVSAFVTGPEDPATVADALRAGRAPGTAIDPR